MALQMMAVRMETWDKATIQQAAEMKHMTVSEYIRRTVIRAAKEALAEGE